MWQHMNNFVCKLCVRVVQRPISTIKVELDYQLLPIVISKALLRPPTTSLPLVTVLIANPTRHFWNHPFSL